MNNEKINILHLQTEINKICGVSKTIYYITKYHNDGFNHSILTLGGDNIKRFEDEKINVELLKSYKSKLFSLCVNTWEVIRFCQKYKINIIHSHHRYFDFIANLASKIIDVKTIVTVQSKVTGKVKFSYKSQVIIAVSNSIKNHLIKNFNIPDSKIKIINNFVVNNHNSCKNITPINKRDLNIEQTEKIIGFIGRFDKEKGVDFLLKSFKLLQAEYSSSYLILVGKGNELNSYKKFIKENSLKVKVIDQTDSMAAIYNLIDIVVLPSRVDPFPLVMLEAGLFEKIFIGARIDGIAEFIEDGNDGVLFESENVLDLKNKILRILTEYGNYSFMGKNLNKKVLNGYTSQVGISKYEKVYKELLQDKYG